MWNVHNAIPNFQSLTGSTDDAARESAVSVDFVDWLLLQAAKNNVMNVNEEINVFIRAKYW